MNSLSIPHFFLKNSFKKQHLITFIILILAFCLESYGAYTVPRKINNIDVYNIFFVYIETLLILWLFESFFESKKAKLLIKIASISFLFWGIIYTLFIEDLSIFHTYSFSLGSFIIILCCIYYFISVFLKDWFIDEKLASNPLFWITTCIFLFYTSTFLYFSSVTFVTDLDRNLILILGSLKRTMSIFMYLVMGLAFYLPYLKKSVQKA
ncbi:hypothetical protein Belba_0639 [Belliella baltica DSM 15883]|uniref:Uncharacterized protein n=1 Tax=Belliella baltica (strain DSM 15883 / CIP 108006 / LMG 21964 / BA134) TaxID=866536 RepID=I3Z226_BELBD|nr:hypothetical protein [Belliella baltica]AFL83294.1 hypothetical protein Belba_0639 [Belliella baltica DSM 15883]